MADRVKKTRASKRRGRPPGAEQGTPEKLEWIKAQLAAGVLPRRAIVTQVAERFEVSAGHAQRLVIQAQDALAAAANPASDDPDERLRADLEALLVKVPEDPLEQNRLMGRALMVAFRRVAIERPSAKMDVRIKQLNTLVKHKALVTPVERLLEAEDLIRKDAAGLDDEPGPEMEVSDGSAGAEKAGVDTAPGAKRRPTLRL